MRPNPVHPTLALYPRPRPRPRPRLDSTRTAQHSTQKPRVARRRSCPLCAPPRRPHARPHAHVDIHPSIASSKPSTTYPSTDRLPPTIHHPPSTIPHLPSTAQHNTSSAPQPTYPPTQSTPNPPRFAHRLLKPRPQSHARHMLGILSSPHLTAAHFASSHATPCPPHACLMPSSPAPSPRDTNEAACCICVCTGIYLHQHRCVAWCKRNTLPPPLPPHTPSTAALRVPHVHVPPLTHLLTHSLLAVQPNA